METTYFILGAVSVVTLIAIGGVVKMFSTVSQLREKVDNLKQSLDFEIRGTHTEFKDSIKDIEMSVQEVHQRIDKTERGLLRSIDSRYDKLYNEVTTMKNKQIDELINTLCEKYNVSI